MFSMISMVRLLLRVVSMTRTEHYRQQRHARYDDNKMQRDDSNNKQISEQENTQQSADGWNKV